MTPKILSPYDPIAAKHTIETLDRRKKHLKDILKDGLTDSYADETKELYRQVKNQKKGPLYNEKDIRNDAILYSNEEPPFVGGNVDATEDNDDTTIADPKVTAPAEEPNYQKIVDEINNEKGKPVDGTENAASSNATKEEKPKEEKKLTN